jgi:hypothetical protein
MVSQYIDLLPDSGNEFDIRDEFDELSDFIRSVEFKFHSFTRDDDVKMLAQKHSFFDTQGGLKLSKIEHVSKKNSNQENEQQMEKVINDKQIGVIRWVANQSRLISVEEGFEQGTQRNQQRQDERH